MIKIINSLLALHSSERKSNVTITTRDTSFLCPVLGPLTPVCAPGRLTGDVSETREGAWPWQVSIQIQSRHHCGGTILNSLWVLTASHCFYKYLSDFHVVAGHNVLSAPGDHTQIRSISEVKMHKGYDDVTSDNDVTLVRLSSPFNFTDHVQPICTPHNVTHELTLNFNHCFISGWGSRLVNRLQEAEVELIDRGTCNQITWYNGFITENMICAGLESGAADTCQGDSGGPLQCYSESEERFYVVGVTSFGEDCGLPYKPGVYARTSRFLTEPQLGLAPADHSIYIIQIVIETQRHLRITY
uniref:Acrosin n=1 Tax=Mastacembelus armatus TaxID=205130 RepID=A0A3Q3LTY7_9TELE